jgi:hypothetical protein
MIAVIIVLAVALLLCVLALLVFLYQQILMTNEINKRLLLLAEDSISGERNTMDALNQALESQASELKERYDDNGNLSKSAEEEPEDSFNPHEALDDLE